MAGETMIEPVRKEVTVKSSVERAFQIFTEGIGSWWPLATHSVARDQAESVVFEARVGGLVRERARDGETHTWGEVLVWEPPRRVVFSWHPGREPNTAQEVEVSFSEADGGTRVTLVHRGWERLGDQAAATRDQYAGGWDAVLGRCYVEACAGEPAAASDESDRPSAYQVVIHRPGPGWQEGVGFRDQPGVEAHIGYMQELHARGCMILGGPFLDDSGGMAILAVATTEEAQALADADPSVQAGLLRFVVRPWMTPLGTWAGRR